IHNLVIVEKENTIDELISDSDKKNLSSELISKDRKENDISETISENENIINLIPLHERHSGIMLANTVYTIINNFGLGDKIIAVTTDNASNMNVFENKLEQLLLNNHTNTLFHHARCAAYILNLIAKDGLNEARILVKK
ncbi:880_t:CDS:2, partial [Racocetra persica]